MKRNYISRIFLYIGVIFLSFSSSLWAQTSKNNTKENYYLTLSEGWEFCLIEMPREGESYPLWQVLDQKHQDRLRENILSLFQGIIISIVGIVTIILYGFLLKTRDRALLFFSLFAFFYGLRILADNYVIWYLIDNHQFLKYLSVFITYTIGIPFTLLFIQLIGWGWKLSLLWILILRVLYASSAILIDIIKGVPAAARDPLNNILVILGCCIVLANFLNPKLKKNRGLRLIFFILIIWFIFVVNENLEVLGLVPWHMKLERPVFFLLFCCLGFFVAHRVIQKQKLLRQQLIQADKMISLGTLVSGVAHEISNPNNYILLNSEILSRAWKDIDSIIEQYTKKNKDFLLAGVPYPEAKKNIPKFISDIHQGAERIKNIIQNLKNYARPSHHDWMEKVDVNAVIQSATNLIGKQIRKITDKFSVEYDHNLPPVKGNFQRLEQVIINLLLNSSQALSDKSKGIFISTRYQRRSECIQIRVKDEGEGIPSSNLAQITDPFFTTRRDRGGLGLGLSLCSTIIKDHGGQIQFDSKPGKGTTVTITLPIYSD